MQRTRRIVLVVAILVSCAQWAAVGALAGEGDPTPEDSSTVEPSATPSASGSSSAEPAGATETATPTETSTPTPSATESPPESPSPSPSPTPEPGALRLTTRAGSGFAQVGRAVSSTSRITNTATVPLFDVVVTNDVPLEVDVLGVPIIDEADQINLVTLGRSEQVVWGFDELAPGESVRLPWFGEAVALGDYRAVNRIEAVSPDVSRVAAEATTYLGSAARPRVEDRAEPATRRPAPIRRRVVTFERVRVEAAVEAGLVAVPGALPLTGVEAVTWAVLAASLILVGGSLVAIVALRKDKRKRAMIAAVLVGLVTVTACVSNDEPSGDRGAGAEATDEDDEVLGTRIERGDDDDEDPPADDDADAPADDADDGDAGDAGDEEPGVVAAPDDDPLDEIDADGDGFVTVPVTEIRTIQPDPVVLPTTILGDHAGDNGMTFTWDEGSMTVLEASSSRSLKPDAIVELVTELNAQGPIGTRAVLRNISERQRVAVNGRIVVTVSGATGTARLTSDPIDVVLEPGGEVTATFAYLLPSGSYSLTSEFATG